MSRKTRFWIGFLVIVLVYGFPLASAIYLQEIWILAVLCVLFLFSVYSLYRLTIKKKKLKYPVVPPPGHPDGYTWAGIPRPLYEDMEQYPWFFEKKRKKPARLTKKKVKKKH